MLFRSKWKRTQALVEKYDQDEIKNVLDLSHTIGGYVIFPGKKINGLNTLNQERGTNKSVNDRFDLTMECIRRYYDQNQDSPLHDVISRYHDFFDLFVDFRGYCEYFLLQDLVDDKFNKVKFYLPFNEFELDPLPRSLEEYRTYLDNIKMFVLRRNQRIQAYYEKSKIK